MKLVIEYIYLALGIIVWITFIVRYSYFSFKYEKYVRTQMPEKSKLLVLFPFPFFSIGFMDGYRAVFNLYKNYKDETTELIGLKTKARRAYNAALLTPVCIFWGLFCLVNLLRVF